MHPSFITCSLALSHAASQVPSFHCMQSLKSPVSLHAVSRAPASSHALLWVMKPGGLRGYTYCVMHCYILHQEHIRTGSLSKRHVPPIKACSPGRIIKLYSEQNTRSLAVATMAYVYIACVVHVTIGSKLCLVQTELHALTLAACSYTLLLHTCLCKLSNSNSSFLVHLV